MEPYLGMLALFPYNFAPKGWMTCAGQILSIAQNSALFSLLGTTYGGDGVTTFALPDLRGRSPIGVGQGPGLSSIALGQISGTENVSLTVGNLPAHNHLIQTVTPSTVNTPLNNMPGPITDPSGGGADQLGYGPTGVNGTMAPGTVTPTGGSQPVGIRNPYLGLEWCIATVGIYPSRN